MYDLCISMLHKQSYPLLLFLISILGLGGFFFYKANYYDTSLNGSEMKETQQHTVPLDVQQTLKQLSELTTFRVPILMYHYVEYVQDKNDKSRISLSTTPYTLEQEIKTLADADFTFMTNAELSEVLDGKASLPKKPILLTFDDGYRDFYTDAYPILKKYHAKATQYMIAGFLNNKNHLTTAELQEIAKDNLVEIGAHTVHHLWLKGRFLKNVSNEVLQSKIMLEKLINKPVLSFAYPFGAFDAQAIKVVENAGFKSAASTIPGIDQKQNQRYFLYRLRPGGRTGKALLDWLNQDKFSAF